MDGWMDSTNINILHSVLVETGHEDHIFAHMVLMVQNGERQLHTKIISPLWKRKDIGRRVSSG